MNLLIQHEYYDEVLQDKHPGRDVERDAASSEAESEKIFDDEDMWRVHDE